MDRRIEDSGVTDGLSPDEPQEVGSGPPHHDPSGGYRNPWPTARVPKAGSLFRWWWERWKADLPPDPEARAFPIVRSDPATPRGAADEIRATWVGHSTYLVQIGGLNLLTDPQFSERASPTQWAGPKRFVPPGISLDSLPPIDAVLQSHDHFDHLDDGTVRRLHERFGESIRWFSPLGYRDWFAKRGVTRLTELDWWQEATIEGADDEVTLRALPAQHWTARSPFSRSQRLWCSWSMETAERRVYFAGDSGWFPEYPQLGERAGPFDLVLLPIGAYDPRWFMTPAHMEPEEAVRAYLELGGRGVFGAMHWGTFRLTDEDPLEPPARTRAAWAAAGLPPEHLWIPRHGETRLIAPQPGRVSAA